MEIHAFSAFSGAGAVLLGEWLGWHHAGACDRDAFCRAVIRHRLPHVPLFDDMDTVPWETAWPSDCSPEDGHASRTASQASDSPTPTSATDGDLSSPPFGMVDPTSRSWRTSQESFLPTIDDTGEDAWPIWPDSGTMRNGWCWERTMPAPTIADAGCGSSLGGETWPTPCATDAARAANRTAVRSDPDSKHHSGTTLTDAIRMWPTPTSSDCVQSRDANKRGNLTLAGASTAWPTPTRAAAKSQGAYGNGSPTLCSAAVPKGGGVLNPPWVESLMGWPPGWTGLPAEVIARVRRERRSARGRQRALRRVSSAAPTPSEPSATGGIYRAP